jgi:hypothetical protein
MGGCLIKTCDSQIVHKTPIDKQKLWEIARILGIPGDIQNEILSCGESIHIYAGTRQRPAAPASAGRRSRATAATGSGRTPSASRRRRQQE